MARRANVSVATVSRALRGLPNVAPSTRSRVEQVARDLDYQVDTYASRLATGRSDTVGLAVPDISTWYFAQVAAGVEAVLADAGMDVLLHSVEDAAGRTRLLSGQSSVRRRLDGLILIDVLLTPAEIRTLAADRVHVVTVGQRTDDFPSVTVDNRSAAMVATRHLLDLGHERIGLIGGSTHTALPFDVPGHRRQGHVEALLAVGLDYHAELEADGGFSVKGGSEAMAHLMTRDPATHGRVRALRRDGDGGDQDRAGPRPARPRGRLHRRLRRPRPRGGLRPDDRPPGPRLARARPRVGCCSASATATTGTLPTSSARPTCSCGPPRRRPAVIDRSRPPL